MFGGSLVIKGQTLNDLLAAEEAAAPGDAKNVALLAAEYSCACRLN